MAQGIQPVSGHAIIELTAAFPDVSAVLLKKRSRPSDNWHTPLEYTQHQQQHEHEHGHHNQLHQAGLGHHIRKKHVTESMAIDFELLSLESGHLPSPSLEQLRSLQNGCETPASLPSPTQTSPTAKQTPHDDTEPQAGFRSGANGELVSAGATQDGVHPATSVDNTPHIGSIHNMSSYQHPDSTHQHTPLVPLVEEMGKEIGAAAFMIPIASSSLTTTLSTAVNCMHDADHEMGMDLTEDGDQLHGECTNTPTPQHGASSGQGTLWQRYASEYRGGGTIRGHPHHASGAVSPTPHVRGHSVRSSNTMRQRKWNSVTKTWQEWRDVPETQELDSMASHLVYGQPELTSSQDSQDAEISDSEFSDIEDLGIRRSRFAHGRQQQRLYSPAMDQYEMTGKGKAAYVSNIAFGKSKKPHDGISNPKDSSGRETGYAAKGVETRELNNMDASDPHLSVTPENTQSLQYHPSHYHRPFPRLDESPPPHITESNGREADPMADAVRPMIMSNTRVRSLSEASAYHQYPYQHQHHLQRPFHNYGHQFNSQYRRSESGGGRGGGNISPGTTSPVSRSSAYRPAEATTLLQDEDNAPLPYISASPSMAWRTAVDGSSLTGIGAMGDSFDPMPSLHHQSSRETPAAASVSRGGPPASRRPRSPTDCFSPRPPSPRSGGYTNPFHLHHLQRPSRHFHQYQATQDHHETWTSIGRDSMLHGDFHGYSSSSTNGDSSHSRGSSNGEISRSPSSVGKAQCPHSPPSACTPTLMTTTTNGGGGMALVESPSRQLRFWSPHNLADLAEQTEGDSMDLEL